MVGVIVAGLLSCLLLCGVNVSVVLWLLQLGLCCTVFATVAGSEKMAPVLKKNCPCSEKNRSRSGKKLPLF